MLQTLASIPQVHFQVITDGSVRGAIQDGGAGLVVLSQDDLAHEWHAPTGTNSSSFQVENVDLKEAIQCLSSISSWASAIIICDCKSLVQAVSNANSADCHPTAVLAMSKSLLSVLAPGHCGLSGNKLTDHQAKLDAADSTRQHTRTSYTESSHPPFLSPKYHPTRAAEGGVHVISLMSRSKPLQWHQNDAHYCHTVPFSAICIKDCGKELPERKCLRSD